MLANIVAIASAVIALAALLVSIWSVRRQEETAAKVRELDGPITEMSIIFRRDEGRRIARVVVSNVGRMAATVAKGGVSYDLPDGGTRHVELNTTDGVRLEPAGTPAYFNIPYLALSDIIASVGPKTPINAWILVAGRVRYANMRMPADFLVSQVDVNSEDTPRRLAIFDAYDDYMHTATLAMIDDLDEDESRRLEGR